MQQQAQRSPAAGHQRTTQPDKVKQEAWLQTSSSRRAQHEAAAAVCRAAEQEREPFPAEPEQIYEFCLKLTSNRWFSEGLQPTIHAD